MEPGSKGKQLLFGDFHPKVDGIRSRCIPAAARAKSLYFP